MGPLLCPRWAPCRMLRSWFACARGLSWALACVLGSATAATAAAGYPTQPQGGLKARLVLLALRTMPSKAPQMRLETEGIDAGASAETLLAQISHANPVFQVSLIGLVERRLAPDVAERITFDYREVGVSGELTVTWLSADPKPELVEKEPPEALRGRLPVRLAARLALGPSGSQEIEGTLRPRLRELTPLGGITIIQRPGTPRLASDPTVLPLFAVCDRVSEDTGAVDSAPAASVPALPARQPAGVEVPAASSPAGGAPITAIRAEERVPLTEALLADAPDAGINLLAEVGPFLAARSVRKRETTQTPEAHLEATLNQTWLKKSKSEKWLLLRYNRWYLMPERDADVALLDQIDRDGGITLETARQVLELPLPQLRTAVQHLQRFSAHRMGGDESPEMRLLLRPRERAALRFWLSLNSAQRSLAASQGLSVRDLNQEQLDLVLPVFPAQMGHAEGAARLWLGTGEAMPLPTVFGPTSEATASSAAFQTGMPLGPEALCLRLTGPPGDGGASESTVALPLVQDSVLASRRNERRNEPRRLNVIAAAWPEDAKETGLATPMNLRCKVVRLGDLLRSLAKATGADLRAAKDIETRYVTGVASGPTVQEFMTALAELYDYRWNHDEKNDYWLLYRPETVADEERRLCEEAKRKDEENRKARQEVTALPELGPKVLAVLGDDQRALLKRGGVVEASLSSLPESLSADIVKEVIASFQRGPVADDGPYQPTPYDDFGGIVRFEPSLQNPGGLVMHVRVTFQYRDEKGDFTLQNYSQQVELQW